KSIRFSIAIILSLVLLMQPLAVSASTAGEKVITDIYQEEFSETVEIEGVDYTYYYFYDDENNRNIKIVNQDTQSVDMVECNIDTGSIYLNGELCGTGSSSQIQEDVQTRADSWIYMTTMTDQISWSNGAGVAVIAGIIAAAIGEVTGVHVISIMGNALSTIAGSAIGGTIRNSIYKFNSTLIHQFRYNWSFTDSNGDYYGPYTSFSPAY